MERNKKRWISCFIAVAGELQETIHRRESKRSKSFRLWCVIGSEGSLVEQLRLQNWTLRDSICPSAHRMNPLRIRTSQQHLAAQHQVEIWHKWTIITFQIYKTLFLSVISPCLLNTRQQQAIGSQNKWECTDVFLIRKRFKLSCWHSWCMYVMFFI